MADTQEYTVRVDMVVEAESPEDAARVFDGMMRDPHRPAFGVRVWPIPLRGWNDEGEFIDIDTLEDQDG